MASWKNKEMFAIGTTVRSFDGMSTGTVIDHTKDQMMVKWHKSGSIGHHFIFEIRKDS